MKHCTIFQLQSAQLRYGMALFPRAQGQWLSVISSWTVRCHPCYLFGSLKMGTGLPQIQVRRPPVCCKRFTTILYAKASATLLVKQATVFFVFACATLGSLLTFPTFAVALTLAPLEYDFSSSLFHEGLMDDGDCEVYSTCSCL